MSARPQARALSSRLQSRRSEIEAAILTRAYAVRDPSDAADPDYTDGLRAAISAAIDYGLAVIEAGDENPPAPPPILISQARMAARSGVSLDVVLRRYIAGHAILGDYLIEEAERSGIRGASLQRLLAMQATLFDGLVELVGEEHRRESCDRPGTLEQRHAVRIERLIDGELVDTGGFAYDFAGYHLGMIAFGPEAPGAVRELAASLGRPLLRIVRDETLAWAWIGGRRHVDAAELEQAVLENLSPHVSLAVGEPNRALRGWRLSHRQARATLPVAKRVSKPLVWYADVALLVSMLQDDLLATSLRELYLTPLERQRDGGEAMRETLRAYLSAGRNVSSAAAALGVARHTVSKRLRTAEVILGRKLNDCAMDLDAALRLVELDSRPSDGAVPHPV